MNIDDEQLLTRLRDLSLVDLDALLVGTEGARYSALLDTYAEDLIDALQHARRRAAELLDVARGADPLALVDASPEARARDGGREAAERMTVRLSERAAACRALARVDDLVGQLIPRLFEADRRRTTMK
jgi:hypothetical protein